MVRLALAMDPALEQAVLRLKGLGPIPVEARMRLWGLYQQARHGDCETVAPDVYNVVEREKWEAWRRNRGLSMSVAQARYISAVDELHSGGRLGEPAAVATAPNPPLAESVGSGPDQLRHVAAQSKQAERQSSSAAVAAAVPQDLVSSSATSVISRADVGRSASVAAGAAAEAPSQVDRIRSATVAPAPLKSLAPPSPLQRSVQRAGAAAPIAAEASPLCGYLVKQRDVLRTWRVRWAVLYGPHLYYFLQRWVLCTARVSIVS